jgi:hypothetical protein
VQFVGITAISSTLVVLQVWRKIAVVQVSCVMAGFEAYLLAVTTGSGSFCLICLSFAAILCALTVLWIVYAKSLFTASLLFMAGVLVAMTGATVIQIQPVASLPEAMQKELSASTGPRIIVYKSSECGLCSKFKDEVAPHLQEKFGQSLQISYVEAPIGSVTPTFLFFDGNHRCSLIRGLPPERVLFASVQAILQPRF